MISKIIIIFWNFQLSFTKYVITLKNNNWFELDHTSIVREIFQFFERLWQISDSISFAQLSISFVKTICFEMFKLSWQINSKFLNFFNLITLKSILIVTKKSTKVLWNVLIMNIKIEMCFATFFCCISFWSVTDWCHA